MPIEDRNLSVGTRLVASYKKQTYVCTVEQEDEGVVFVLEDGRRFKSPSAAGSAVMGGKAVNGWRCWSLAAEVPEQEAAATEVDAQPRPKANGRSRGRGLIYKLPHQRGVAEGLTRWFCNGCMKSFITEGGEAPAACPEGHGAADPEAAPATTREPEA